MRVKVRFDAESCQAPVVLDLRFLPRIGERLEIGFRRVIEVLDVRRIDTDNRYTGVVRGRLVREERRAAPPPRPMLQPMNLPIPDWTLPTALSPSPASMAPPPAPAPVLPPSVETILGPLEPMPAMAAEQPPNYGDISFADLTAALQQQAASS